MLDQNISGDQRSATKTLEIQNIARILISSGQSRDVPIQ